MNKIDARNSIEAIENWGIVLDSRLSFTLISTVRVQLYANLAV
jgi:hypothetical protein